MAEIRSHSFREMVMRKARNLGMSTEEVFSVAGIKSRTMFRRLSYTGDITLDEFHRLDIVLRFSNEEKLLLIDRVMK